MTKVLVVLAIFVLIGIKFYGKDFNEGFLDKGQTDALNGMFIFIVLASHMLGYLDAQKTWPLYEFCKTYLGQLMVTSFMFVSGYGCATSYQKKGAPYVDSMPRNRILPVLLNFDIAVLIYAVVNHFLLDQNFTFKQILVGLTGWESIGNSNWYIFAILCLYIGFYICFKLFGQRESHFFLFYSMILFTLLYIKVVEYFKTPSIYWFYDTALCFTVGVIFAYYKDKIYAVVTKSNATYFSLLGLGVAVLLYMHFNGFAYTSLYRNVYAVIFILTLVLILMKVKIGNAVLSFFGTHVFEIYIFQRIPMSLLKRYTPLTSDPKYYFLYFALVLLSTMVIAYFMNKFYKAVDGLIKVKPKK